VGYVSRPESILEALDLRCINQFAGILWSKAFCKEFEEFFGLDDQNHFPDQPSFYLTLTDVSCTPDHDASSIKISKFKRKLQAGSRGLNYVGWSGLGFTSTLRLGLCGQ
jgi:hypothetical protein